VTTIRYVLNVDGACRGNPGPGSAAAVVADEAGATLLERGYHLGETTNNVAEYTALLRGLELVRDLAKGKEPPKVLVRSDSELMVKQLAGEYRVKNPKLQPLFVKVKALLAGMPGSKVEHVRRELNREADALANRVLDLGCDVLDDAS
jgi:ribonuclease HI